jgi:hypothetical protein
MSGIQNHAFTTISAGLLLLLDSCWHRKFACWRRILTKEIQFEASKTDKNDAGTLIKGDT